MRLSVLNVCIASWSGARANRWVRGAACLLVLSACLSCSSAAFAQGYPSTNYPAYEAPAQAPPPQGYPPYVPAVPPQQSPPPEVASLPRQTQFDFETPFGLRQFEPTEIMAMVGDQPILACDILPDIDRHFRQFEGRVPPETLAIEREKAIRQLLQREIERKLAYVYFLSRAPAEALPQVDARINEGFLEQQLPRLLERFEVETPAELDALLRGEGSSLAQQRRMFREQVMASEALREASTAERMVNHEEMLAYYHAHFEDFSFPAEVRWEQLMVDLNQFPNREAAWEALANMGNEVLRGAPFDVVARRSSSGPRSQDGGEWDWTTQGSLKWTAVDQMLFNPELPPEVLSTIVCDEGSFHIVRVLERRDAGHTPFREAQEEIHEKILEEYRQGKIEDFIETLQDSTTVWTIFDDMPASSTGTTATAPAAGSSR